MPSSIEICGGCGRRSQIVAVYEGMNGLRVCLQCYQSIQAEERQRKISHAHEMNGLYAQMEYMAGLPRGTMPREPIPQPAPIIENRNNMTVNNHITVTGGTVGAINTGNVERLNVAIDQAIRNSDGQLAEAIRQLGTAIANNTTITPAQKNEASECLIYLIEQVNTIPERRQAAIVLSVKDTFLKVLSVSADLMQLWSTVGEPIRRALGF
jgi:hypothetical protein